MTISPNSKTELSCACFLGSSDTLSSARAGNICNVSGAESKSAMEIDNLYGFAKELGGIA
jgi:hypothetical protein